jgi:glutathione synthase/RimK-type ligase-like ATP-grasp enzyme
MEPPRSNTSVTFDILNALAAGGAEVDILSEQCDVIDVEHVRFDYDAFLFKSHSPLAESIAAAAHERGVRLVNEYPATMRVRDKILTSAMLLYAGIPTPRTFVVDALEKLRPYAQKMPLVVKPFKGRRGMGIEFLENEAAFDELLARRGDEEGEGGHGGGEDGAVLGERLVFAQELLEHEPFDYKAYAIGDYVHTIRRIFPAKTKEEKLGTPVEDDPVLDDLVRRCGEVFGLELYGVDLVNTPNGYAVIEVNCFPGYKGVPNGGQRIADHILQKL